MSGDPLFAQAVRGSCGDPRIPGGQSLAQYRRLSELGELGRYLVVEYRCDDPAACVLARVFTTTSGTFVHKPAHVYTSPAEASGIAVHAGMESAYPLPAPSASVALTCGHVFVRREVEEVLVDISLAHRRGCPTGRRIGR